jgi:type II secretory pathway component PulF
VRSAVADRLLGRIPLLGKVRQHWALARFSQVSHAGLLAAMRLSEVTRMAGEASQSGRLLHAAQTAAPRIESGGRLAESLRATQTFPRAFVDGIATAEEAGTLDQEMQRWADLETEEATEATARAAEWLPRLFYAVVALYIICRIVTMFFGIYGEAFKMLDG